MTAALEGGEWSAARPGRTLPPGKTRYPFYRRLGGPQGRSGRAEILVPTGIRSRTVQPIVTRYTDWPGQLFCFWLYNNFYPFFVHFLSDSFEIRYQWSDGSGVKHSRFSWKSAKLRPYFFAGCRWNCFYACTVKWYDSLEVKNALANYVLRHGVHHLQFWCTCYEQLIRVPSKKYVSEIGYHVDVEKRFKKPISYL